MVDNKGYQTALCSIIVLVSTDRMPAIDASIGLVSKTQGKFDISDLKLNTKRPLILKHQRPFCVSLIKNSLLRNDCHG
jgi:hypothetical protein